MSQAPASGHPSFMDLALGEASLGVGRTHPNPPVGAVIVRDGVVVGRGHHRRAGQPHAEAMAIADAGESARGADMYVTLEPHDHHGKTPPCTLAIIKAGLRRVYVGAFDPNPLVSGRGVQRLRDAGIEVEVGLRSEACATLIRPFAKLVASHRPFVVLKAACTLDGRIATRTGDSRWVSSEEARLLVHRWRDEFDAVLVGARTVAADDPMLTTRLLEPVVAGRTPRNPIRVLLSGALNVNPEAKVFNGAEAPTWIYTACDEGATADRLRARGVEVSRLAATRERLDPVAVMADLGRRGVSSLLVEGGADVHASMLAAGVVDEVRLFIAPKIVGDEGRAWMGPLAIDRMSSAWRLAETKVTTVGPDVLLVGRPELG